MPSICDALLRMLPNALREPLLAPEQLHHALAGLLDQDRTRAHGFGRAVAPVVVAAAGPHEAVARGSLARLLNGFGDVGGNFRARKHGVIDPVRRLAYAGELPQAVVVGNREFGEPCSARLADKFLRRGGSVRLLYSLARH